MLLLRLLLLSGRFRPEASADAAFEGVAEADEARAFEGEVVGAVGDATESDEGPGELI